MGMRLEMRHRLMILCPVCGTNAADEDEHNPECPRALAAKAARERKLYRCPKCRDGKVERTLDDLLECRGCRAVFSRGLLIGRDPDKVEQVTMFDVALENAFPVLVSPEPGDGTRFDFDRLKRLLVEQEPVWWRGRLRSIDRIDQRGNIREHLTLDGERTLCGRVLDLTQAAAGNGLCRVCDRMRTRGP